LRVRRIPTIEPEPEESAGSFLLYPRLRKPPNPFCST
jgi:hypothetical protein